MSKIKDLEKPIVYIVDSDHKLLESLSSLFRLNDVQVEVFETAEKFLKKKLTSRAACLIVEVNLLKMDGIELLEHINNLGFRLPTIVMSTDSDVSGAVRAMQAKAIDFIEKPFIPNTLVEMVMDVIKQV
jgi:FixJ family two-component response regulator